MAFQNRKVRVACSAALVFAGIFFTASRRSYSLDPGSYVVQVLGDSVRIYSETVTTYTLSSSDMAFSLPDTPFQQVLAEKPSQDKKFVTLRSGAPHASAGPGPDDTADTRYLNITSSAIRRLAEQFRGMAAPAREVERFVYTYIENKQLGVPFLPADDIAASRTGDCTEHAMLAIAILRAIGIPARAVVGMIFSDEFMGEKNVFVYHMWAEAYAGGAWELIDATRPDDRHPNRYIAFCTHHLKTATPLNYLKAVKAIKNLTVLYSPE
jgi:transglutaminase-like putative cysteine protease